MPALCVQAVHADAEDLQEVDVDVLMVNPKLLAIDESFKEQILY